MSSLVLPYPVGGEAAGWTLTTYTRYTAVSKPAAGGLCLAEFDQLEPEELWLIDHAVIHCTSSTASSLRLYEGDPAVARLLDGTDNGNFMVGDWPAGLLIEPSRRLVAQWSGASAGAVGTLRIQVRVLRKG